MLLERFQRNDNFPVPYHTPQPPSQCPLPLFFFFKSVNKSEHSSDGRETPLQPVSCVQPYDMWEDGDA